MSENELIKRETVTDLVAKYNAAVSSFEKAFNAFRDAEKSFTVFKDYCFPYHITRKGSYYSVNSMDNVAKVLKAEAWEGIIRKTQMREAMTEKRRDEIDAQIQNDKMPEITVENVYSILTSLYNRSGDLMTESIKEAFEFLRPRQSRHKTNSQFDVPKKVIITYWVERVSYSKNVSIHWNCSAKMQVVNNAFSLLDGKGVSKYPSNLETAVRDAIYKGLDSCETEYFRCKWYMAGTFHLEFKRLDLLAKLNRIGGGKRLYQ